MVGKWLGGSLSSLIWFLRASWYRANFVRLNTAVLVNSDFDVPLGADHLRYGALLNTQHRGKTALRAVRFEIIGER